MSMLLALPSSPTQLDEETASVIAQLALADLDEAAEGFADQQLAFDLQAEALETMLRNFGIDPVRARRQARDQLVPQQQQGPSTASSASASAQSPPVAGPLPRPPVVPIDDGFHAPSPTRSPSTSEESTRAYEQVPPLQPEDTSTRVHTVDHAPTVVLRFTEDERPSGDAYETYSEELIPDNISELECQESSHEEGNVYETAERSDLAYSPEEHWDPDDLDSQPTEYEDLYEPTSTRNGVVEDSSRSEEHALGHAEREERPVFAKGPFCCEEAPAISPPPAAGTPAPVAAVEDARSSSDPPSPPAPTRYTCEGCYDRTSARGCLEGPCGHCFCPACAARLARAALADEALFPLRCCGQRLPARAAEAALPAALRAPFRAKQAEHAVAPAERVYCAAAACGAFLGPCAAPAGASALPCAACGAATCAACRQPAHAGRACAARLAELFDALARARGWQRCPHCGATVERTEGCAHIVCRCAREFCYTCGAAYSATHVCGEADAGPGVGAGVGARPVERLLLEVDDDA
ncbi:hypothetical protein HDZ31DRAFT_69031 [Schizophyllum fasciatum]